MGRRYWAAVVGGLTAGAMWVASASAAEVQWFGQAAFKITTPGGKVIMIDPFITKNPKTPEALKDLGKIGKVDLILVTHGHGDHLGDAVELAKMTGAKVAVNADMGTAMQNAGLLTAEQLIRYNKGNGLRPLEGITVYMTRAEHSSTIVIPGHDGKPTTLPGGDPVGFVIEMENGKKIYHTGDTGVFGDMAWIGEYYKPDVVLVCIGGHFTMDPQHAAYAVKNLIKPKVAMPMHYGTFPPLKGTPEQFKEALGDWGGEVVVMQPGDTRTF
jgi:L-ascorbate metabolism protein UlaG (beta-lactamase superfamily)